MLRAPLHAHLIRLLLTILIFMFIIIALYPMLWMLSTSFKTYDESLTWPPTIFPKEFVLTNYIRTFQLNDFFRFLINSVIYSVAGSLLSVLLAAMGGYAFAKFKFKGQRILFFIVVSVLIIPGQVMMIPIFLICKAFGWVNTYLGLIVPGIVNAFGIFLIRQFAMGVPNDFFDSARIDGAGEIRIFASIFLSLVKPAVTTLIVLEFMGRWNDLFWPLIITNSSSMSPLTLGLTVLYRTEWTIVRWPELCACMTIAALPTLVLYAMFQKYFTRGIILTSGVKG